MYKKITLLTLSTIFLFFSLSTTALAAMRERPQIKNSTILTDNNLLLRAENPRMTTNYSTADWDNLKKYNLNTVRILIYKEPQSYGGGCGTNCPGLVRSVKDFATEQDWYNTIIDAPNTTNDTFGHLDRWVAQGEQHGFYVIIDYHPVLGIDTKDVKVWWKYVAPRYKDKTHVIYEMANEPNGIHSNNSNGVPHEFEVYNIIRNAGATNTPIIMFSNPHFHPNDVDHLLNRARNLKQLGVDFSKTVIGVHIYWREVDNNMKNDVIRFKNEFPLINTEIGSLSSKDNGLALIELMESTNTSWVTLDGMVDNLPNSNEKRLTIEELQSIGFWQSDPLVVGQGTPNPTNNPTPTPNNPTPTNKPYNAKIDVNDDGVNNLQDVIYLIKALFLSN